MLLSGDEVDVYFETDGRIDLVEVKSRRSNWHDLQRGVYQCVKYRAVLDAQRKQLMPSSRSAATLVVETRPSNELLALAKVHDVRVLQVIVR